MSYWTADDSCKPYLRAWERAWPVAGSGADQWLTLRGLAQPHPDRVRYSREWDALIAPLTDRAGGTMLTGLLRHALHGVVLPSFGKGVAVLRPGADKRHHSEAGLLPALQSMARFADWVTILATPEQPA